MYSIAFWCLRGSVYEAFPGPGERAADGPAFLWETVSGNTGPGARTTSAGEAAGRGGFGQQRTATHTHTHTYPGGARTACMYR